MQWICLLDFFIMKTRNVKIDFREFFRSKLDVRRCRKSSSKSGYYRVTISTSFLVGEIPYARVHYIGWPKTFDEDRPLSEIVIESCSKGEYWALTFEIRNCYSKSSEKTYIIPSIKPLHNARWNKWFLFNYSFPKRGLGEEWLLKRVLFLNIFVAYSTFRYPKYFSTSFNWLKTGFGGKPLQNY